MLPRLLLGALNRSRSAGRVSRGTGPGGWKRLLYRNSGELGAAIVGACIGVAGVMLRFSNMPLRRSEDVDVGVEAGFDALGVVGRAGD